MSVARSGCRSFLVQNYEEIFLQIFLTIQSTKWHREFIEFTGVNINEALTLSIAYIKLLILIWIMKQFVT